MSKEFINLLDRVEKPVFEVVSKSDESVFKCLHEMPEITRLKKRHEEEIKQATEVSYRIGYENALLEAKDKYGSQVESLQEIVNGMVVNIHSEKKKMVELTRELFPEVIWQLIEMFFAENAQHLSATLKKRIESAFKALINEPACILRVNPEDVSLVRENLDIPEVAIEVVEDTEIQRGSYSLKAGYAEIDGDVLGFIKRLR